MFSNSSMGTNHPRPTWTPTPPGTKETPTDPLRLPSQMLHQSQTIPNNAWASKRSLKKSRTTEIIRCIRLVHQRNRPQRRNSAILQYQHHRRILINYTYTFTWFSIYLIIIYTSNIFILFASSDFILFCKTSYYFTLTHILRYFYIQFYCDSSLVVGYV